MNLVNGVQHNGRVAAFGPGDLGSNPGEEQYIIKFDYKGCVIQIIQAYNSSSKRLCPCNLGQPCRW